MSKVFIGVGHGGSDPGAVSGGFREKDLNINIATYCNEELIRHGVETKMSRYGDEEDTLEEEIRECNAFAPDLAIDIHNNAGGGNGAEAFYHYGGGLSKALADNVLAEIVKIGQNSRGAKIKLNDAGRDWFGFIRETIAPAVIVECAFVDNAEDMTIIDTEEKRKTMGIALAKGILATLGIPYVPFVASTPTPEPTPEPKPEVQPEPSPEISQDVHLEEKPEEEKQPVVEQEQKKKKILDIIIKFLEWLMSILKGE